MKKDDLPMPMPFDDEVPEISSSIVKRGIIEE